jgi:hypothetical protein
MPQPKMSTFSDLSTKPWDDCLLPDSSYDHPHVLFDRQLLLRGAGEVGIRTGSLLESLGAAGSNSNDCSDGTPTMGPHRAGTAGTPGTM